MLEIVATNYQLAYLGTKVGLFKIQRLINGRQICSDPPALVGKDINELQLHIGWMNRALARPAIPIGDLPPTLAKLKEADANAAAIKVRPVPAPPMPRSEPVPDAPDAQPKREKEEVEKKPKGGYFSGGNKGKR